MTNAFDLSFGFCFILCQLLEGFRVSFLHQYANSILHGFAFQGGQTLSLFGRV